MKKKIYTFIFILFFLSLTLSAQPAQQRPAAKPAEPPRINSVYLGLSGGLSVPFANVASTQSLGGFGQGEIFVFLSERVTAGADYAYHYLPGKDDYPNVPMQEVLISGAYYFKSSWNINMSFGLGYYGEPGTSHFGMVPGVGIMPEIANNIYFYAKASAAFFNIDGHLFKFGAGIVFMVYQHKPIKK